MPNVDTEFAVDKDGVFYYCAYLQKNVHESDCYDLQMIACNCIKPDIFPNWTIDKNKLSACCRVCLRRIENENL